MTATLVGSPLSHAQSTKVGASAPPPLRPALNWVRAEGAEDCIGPLELRQRVEGELGRAMFGSADEATLVLEGAIRPTPKGYLANLAVSDAQGVIQGRRELATRADCRSLDESLVVVIAITLRGGAVGGIPLPTTLNAELERLFADESSELDPGSLPPQASASPPPPRVPEPQVEAPQAPAPIDNTRPPSLPASVALSAGMFLQSGMQPGVALGPQVDVHLRTAAAGEFRLRGRLGLRSADLTLPDPSNPAVAGTAEGLRMAWSAGLLACPLSWQGATSTLTLCAGPSLGQVTLARTRDFARFNSDTSAVRLWVAVDAAAELSLPLTASLDLWLSGELNLRLRGVRYTFVAGDGTVAPLFASDTLGAAGSLGLRLGFP